METNSEEETISVIGPFINEWKFLSNFYPSPVKYEGHLYKSVEHAYQAAKTIDEIERSKFRGNIKASKAKALGKKVTMRKDWESIKLNVMYELIKQKFYKHDDLKETLLITRDIPIAELNSWNDIFWGICNGKGENHLGKILMRVRGELKEKENETQE